LQAFVRSQLGYFITGKSHVKAAPVQLSATELASWQWQVIVGQNDHTSQISKNAATRDRWWIKSWRAILRSQFLVTTFGRIRLLKMGARCWLLGAHMLG